MAQPPKRRVHSSRLTPKGTIPQGEAQDTDKAKGAPSPWWVTFLLFGFLVVGAVIIIINYLGYVPGGEASNTYLIIGLGFILAGMITATQLR